MKNQDMPKLLTFFVKGLSINTLYLIFFEIRNTVYTFYTKLSLCEVWLCILNIVIRAKKASLPHLLSKTNDT